MGFTKYTTAKEKERVRINEGIRAKELRVITESGDNFGVLPLQDALQKAKEAGLDLIEISPNAKPPVAKIADYGKFKYEQKKKAKEVRAKSNITETKSAQVKIGTGRRDMEIKASRIAGWLREGHRVKVDLFLWGRYKYMEFNFLKERLERFLAIIPESFKIADEIAKSPKGLSATIEHAKGGSAWQASGKVRSALAAGGEDEPQEETSEATAAEESKEPEEK